MSEKTKAKEKGTTRRYGETDTFTMNVVTVYRWEQRIDPRFSQIGWPYLMFSVNYNDTPETIARRVFSRAAARIKMKGGTSYMNEVLLMWYAQSRTENLIVEVTKNYDATSASNVLFLQSVYRKKENAGGLLKFNNGIPSRRWASPSAINPDRDMVRKYFDHVLVGDFMYRQAVPVVVDRSSPYFDASMIAKDKPFELPVLSELPLCYFGDTEPDNVQKEIKTARQLMQFQDASPLNQYADYNPATVAFYMPPIS